MHERPIPGHLVRKHAPHLSPPRPKMHNTRRRNDDAARPRGKRMPRYFKRVCVFWRHVNSDSLLLSSQR